MTATQTVPDAPVLEEQKDAFFLPDLITKAAEYRNLELPHPDRSEKISGSIATYVLDEPLLAFLDERGIKREARPDCQHEIFTLVDMNRQRVTPGWSPSNYWNFQLSDGQGNQLDPREQLRIQLRFQLCLSDREHGIELRPRAYGTYVNACDELPNFRMFKALVESDRQEIPPIAQEIVKAKKRCVVVTWTDIGVGNIRRISRLFRDFARGNKLIERIARSGMNPFEPEPFSQLVTANMELEPFVTKHAQATLFDAWREQLAHFCYELSR